MGSPKLAVTLPKCSLQPKDGAECAEGGFLFLFAAVEFAEVSVPLEQLFVADINRDECQRSSLDS